MLALRAPPARPLVAAAWAALLVAGAFTAVAAGPAAAAGVEWRIESAESILDTTRTLDGPVVIAAGGVLTIRNSTVLFALSQDGGLKIEVLPGGSLIVENATMKPTDAGAAFYWNFLVAGHLEMRRAEVSHLRGDAGLGGLEMTGSDILVEDSYFHDNRYYAIMVHSGAPLLRNTTLQNHVVGIFVTPGASPRLENVTIGGSTTFGLRVNDASPVVRNLTIVGPGGVGVGGNGAALDIVGCKISGTDVGVEAVLGTTGSVSACEFLTVGTALRANASPVRLEGSTILSAAIGVNATNAAVVVEGNMFLNVPTGVRVAGDAGPGEPGQGLSNRFEGTGVGFDIYVPNFFLEGNTFSPAMTGARILHTLTLVIVSNTGTPIRGARVDLKDALGAAAFGGLTDVHGNVTAVLEEYRVLSNGTRQNMTPHSVRIEVGTQVQEATLNATSDRAERFTLAPVPTPSGGVTREGLLLFGAALGLAGVAGALSVHARRRRRRKIAEARGSERARRRAPRRGR